MTGRRSGEIQRTLSDDVERLELFLAHAVPDLTAAVVVVAVTTGWMLAVDWRMALAAVACVAVAILLSSKAMRRSQDLLGDYMVSMARMNGSLVEMVRGLEIVRTFNRSGDTFAEARDAIRSAAEFQADWGRRFLPLFTGFFTLAAAPAVTIVPVGLLLWANDSIGTAELLFFFVIGLGYGGPVAKLLNTLLSLIGRFWDVESGAVRVGGVDVRDLTERQLFDLFTVVFQEPYLFQGTIRDNIAFGRADATDAAIEDAARRAQANDFITALPGGYDALVGEGGATLSGGERQRISIARAIVEDAPILLLDEATAALDPINEQAVQRAVAELVRDRTVLVVAHRLNTIRSAEIVVLDDGQVVERGRHDELLTNAGLYAHLWTQRTTAAAWRIQQPG